MTEFCVFLLCDLNNNKRIICTCGTVQYPAMKTFYYSVSVVHNCYFHSINLPIVRCNDTVLSINITGVRIAAQGDSTGHFVSDELHKVPIFYQFYENSKKKCKKQSSENQGIFRDLSEKHSQSLGTVPNISNEFKTRFPRRISNYPIQIPKKKTPNNRPRLTPSWLLGRFYHHFSAQLACLKKVPYFHFKLAQSRENGYSGPTC